MKSKSWAFSCGLLPIFVLNCTTNHPVQETSAEKLNWRIIRPRDHTNNIENELRILIEPGIDNCNEFVFKYKGQEFLTYTNGQLLLGVRDALVIPWGDVKLVLIYGKAGWGTEYADYRIGVWKLTDHDIVWIGTLPKDTNAFYRNGAEYQTSVSYELSWSRGILFDEYPNESISLRMQFSSWSSEDPTVKHRQELIVSDTNTNAAALLTKINSTFRRMDTAHAVAE